METHKNETKQNDGLLGEDQHRGEFGQTHPAIARQRGPTMRDERLDEHRNSCRVLTRQILLANERKS